MNETHKYHLKIKPSALKELKRISEPFRTNIHRAVLALRDNPRPQGIRKLVQREGIFRMRIGNYRVIFKINDDSRIIQILEIKHRKEAYR